MRDPPPIVEEEEEEMVGTTKAFPAEKQAMGNPSGVSGVASRIPNDLPAETWRLGVVIDKMWSLVACALGLWFGIVQAFPRHGTKAFPHDPYFTLPYGLVGLVGMERKRITWISLLLFFII